MVICCAVCLAAIGQSPVKPPSPDSVVHAVDSSKKVADTLSAPARDSLSHDSAWLVRDSLRRDSLMRDSIRKAAAVPSAAALQHQIDSANAATSIVSDPAVDSLKLRMDAMSAAAANNSRGSTNPSGLGPPGMAGALQRQPLGSAYSPATGSTPPGSTLPSPGIPDSSHSTTATGVAKPPGAARGATIRHRFRSVARVKRFRSCPISTGNTSPFKAVKYRSIR